MKVKFKVNTASHIASLPFKHLRGKSWGDAHPPDKIRDDLAKKLGWKNGFIIVEEREGERKPKIVEYKYPFITKRGTPVFEGLIAAWKRAHQVAKSGRGDKYDVEEAKEVIRVLKGVIKKWKNEKGAKGEFYKLHAADWLGESAEAISDPTIVDSFVSELTPSIVRFHDFLGLTMPKKLGQSSVFGEFGEPEYGEAEVVIKSARELLDRINQNKEEPYAPEMGEAKTAALVKQLKTHAIKAKDIEEVKDEETFVQYIKDIKEALRKDRYRYGFRLISALLVPVAGRLIGGGMEPPKAFGLALSMIGAALDDLRKTRGIID